MKLVISPAKSLDYESVLPTETTTQGVFLEEAQRLNKLLKTKSAASLSKLMHISDNLGRLNHQRNQDWELPFTEANSRQAIYAFNGDVYRGLDAYTLKSEQLEKTQETVRILSGLYGVLKPLDLIQPYRLEMGTKLAIGKHKSLYEFWKTKLTNALNNELNDNELFLNLASNEYFKAIDTKTLKVPVVNIAFKEFKNGNYKIIAVFAKLARGLMARYIIDTDAKTIDDVKGFNVDNYAFSEALSSENELVFTR